MTQLGLGEWLGFGIRMVGMGLVAVWLIRTLVSARVRPMASETG